MAPFLKSLSLPGALPRSELIAEIVPSFHPSIPPNIQTISSGLFLLEFLSGLYKGRAVRDHFLIILISLLVWRSGGKMFHSYWHVTLDVTLDVTRNCCQLSVLLAQVGALASVLY